MADYSSDILLRPSLFLKYLLRHGAVLVRVHLIIEIMHQSDDSPLFLIFAVLARHVSHYSLN